MRSAITPVCFLLAMAATVTAAAGEGACYSTIPKDTFSGGWSTFEFNSHNSCRDTCKVASYPYAALKDDRCQCGWGLAPNSALLPYEDCNLPCPGFKDEPCGGKDAWTIINVGSNMANVTFTEPPVPTATAPPVAINGTSSGILPTSTTTSSTGTPIPTAGAVAEGARMLGIAAVIGLGAVYNLL